MKTTVIGAYRRSRTSIRTCVARCTVTTAAGSTRRAFSGVLDESTPGGRWVRLPLNWAGIDVVNDGQVRWGQDLLAPFARAWNGTERGPLSGSTTTTRT